MLELIFPNHLPSMIGYYVWKAKVQHINKEYLKRTFYAHNTFYMKIKYPPNSHDLLRIRARAYNYRNLKKPDTYHKLIKGSKHKYLPNRYYYTAGTQARDFIGYSYGYN